jgi:ribose transport system ATP-binding protein
VLHDVDLDLMPGEVHALVGQNGSGKSTLIKCLSGYHSPDRGASLTVAGRDIQLPLDPTQPRVLGLAFLHQDLALVPDLTVLENMRIGRFSTGFGWRIRWRTSEGEVRAALSRLDVDHISPHATVGSLSAVERAMVALARAVQELEEAGVGVLVLDEPTAHLPRDGVDQLFEAIEKVTNAGAGVLFVTHRLEEVRQVADRVTVLRDGERVATANVADVSERELIELIVGRPMSQLYPELGKVRDDVVLTVDDVSGSKVQGFSLRLHQGETVGLTGLVGMGQETIPYLLYGADPSPSGRIEIGESGRDLATLKPAGAMKMGLGLLPGDRLRNGGVGSASVRENITLTTLREYFRSGRIHRRRERSAVVALMGALEVRPNDPEHAFAELSGGNQQKVLLARLFAGRPKILLLDEPTQGVDIGTRQEVFRHIRRFTDQGGAIIVSSSEYEDLAHLCDRVIVFRDGVPVIELEGRQLTPQSIVEQAFASTSVRAGGAPNRQGRP